MAAKTRWRLIGGFLVAVAMTVLLQVPANRLRDWRASRAKRARMQTALQAALPADLPATPFPVAAIIPQDKALERELGAMVAPSFAGYYSSSARTVFSPDERYLAWFGAGDGFARAQGIVELWDVQTGELLRRFQLGTLYVTAVSFSPSGRRLMVTGRIPQPSNEKRVLVLDVVDQTCVFAAAEFCEGTPLLIDDETLLVYAYSAMYRVDLATRAVTMGYDRLANYRDDHFFSHIAESTFQITDIAMLADGETVVAFGPRGVLPRRRRYDEDYRHLVHVERWNWRTGELLAAWDPMDKPNGEHMTMMPALDSPGEILLVTNQTEERLSGLVVQRVNLETGDVAPLFRTLDWGRNLWFIHSLVLPLVKQPGILTVAATQDGNAYSRYVQLDQDGKTVRALAPGEYWRSSPLVLSPKGTYIALERSNEKVELLARENPEEFKILDSAFSRGSLRWVLSRGGSYLTSIEHMWMGTITVVPTAGQDPATITEPIPSHVAQIESYEEYSGDTTKAGAWTSETRLRVRVGNVRRLDPQSTVVPRLQDLRQDWESWIQDVVLCDDGLHVAAIQKDGGVVGSHVDGSAPFSISLATPQDAASCLTALPGDAGFMIGVRDGSVIRCDWQGTILWRTAVGQTGVRRVLVTGQGTALAHRDGALVTLDLETGAVLSETPVDDKATLVALSPDGTRLTYLTSKERLVSQQGGRTVERRWTSHVSQLVDRGDRLLALGDGGLSYLDPNTLQRVDVQHRGMLMLFGNELHPTAPTNPKNPEPEVSAGHIIDLRHRPSQDSIGQKIDPELWVNLDTLRSGVSFTYAAVARRNVDGNFWQTWLDTPVCDDILSSPHDLGRQIQLTRADDSQATGTLMLFADDQWLFFTPDGRFDGSEGVARHLVRPTTTDGLPTVAPFTMDSPQRVPGLLHTTLRLPFPEATPKAE